MLYDLTEVTGDAAHDKRTSLILGRVVDRRLVTSSLLALLVGALVGIVGFALFGASGALLGLLAAIFVLVITTFTSSRGLKLKLWRSLYNKTRANNGRPMRIHDRVDTTPVEPMRVVSSMSGADLAFAAGQPPHPTTRVLEDL